ncbi:CHST9 [Mytilus edulis]|uniref:Carbohydrate sulfotransferase n=1 Tax=Mytilus edulis TaxID=6550 RepID=A0A8S3T2W7_MYTED|nr:CHST9 [Mytilus edulis]
MRISGNIKKISYNSVTEKAVEKYFTVSTILKNTLVSFNGPDSHNTGKNISILSQKDVLRLTKQELRQIKRSGTSSPIVVRKYKLIFFWNEKAGCTYWKRLLQFIQGLKNKDVHIPGRNGLTYLTQFKDNEITDMMFNDTWTKAVFVREPRERVLSAFLEKGLNPARMRDMCRRPAVKSLSEFITLIKTCKDVHWSSQVKLPRHLYKYTWIGKMPDINTFTENLLTKIGNCYNITMIPSLKTLFLKCMLMIMMCLSLIRNTSIKQLFASDNAFFFLYFYHESRRQNTILLILPYDTVVQEPVT